MDGITRVVACTPSFSAACIITAAAAAAAAAAAVFRGVIRDIRELSVVLRYRAAFTHLLLLLLLSERRSCQLLSCLTQVSRCSLRLVYS
jgi:hypothetical protein